MSRKILIMGLPGARQDDTGWRACSPINAAMFNADEVRANINKDLGFSQPIASRHARHGLDLRSGGGDRQDVIADFICPAPEARAAFGPCLRNLGGPHRGGVAFADANAMFVPPEAASIDVRVTARGVLADWAEKARWPCCVRRFERAEASLAL